MTSNSAKPSEWAMEAAQIVETLAEGAFENQEEHESAALCIESRANREAVKPLVKPLVEALADLTERCDSSEGVRADGSNIQTMHAHAALEPWRYLLDESGE